MAKTYVEELSQWVKQKKSAPRRDKNTVAFLAVKEDVVIAIEAGYSGKTIWEHLKENGKISCRYETFLNHVKKYIRQCPQEKNTHDDPLKQDKDEEKKNKPTAKIEFKFDAKPNKEDLI